MLDCLAGGRFTLANALQFKFGCCRVLPSGSRVIIVLGSFSLFSGPLQFTVLAALLPSRYSPERHYVVADRNRENSAAIGVRGPHGGDQLPHSPDITVPLITSGTHLVCLICAFTCSAGEAD